MKKKSVLKKVLIIVPAILLGVALIGLSIWLICYDGLYIGMMYSDYMSVIDENDRFDYAGYSFYEKKNGDSMLVRFELTDGDLVIDEIRYYPKVFLDNSKESFEKIETGMSLYEVVSLVGVPHYSGLSGSLAVTFDADDGTEYRIYFSQVSPKDNSEWLVSRVMELK